MMEPATSSSGSSSSDGELSLPDRHDSKRRRRSSSNEKILPPQSFDDLPSDDSVGVSSSDDDGDGSSGDSDGENDGKEEGEEGDAAADALLDRIDARRRGDVAVGTTTARGRKAGERALAIASERLARFSEERRGGGGGASSSKVPKKAGGSKGRLRREDANVDDDSDERPEVGSSGAATAAERPGEKGRQENKKKKNSKHRPTEASSKRSDYYRRGAPDLNSSGTGVAVGANKYKPRDPRLEDGLSGHLDPETFERRYAFLEEMKEGEIATLEKRVAARKKTGKKGQKARRKLGLTAEGGGGLEEDMAELTRLKRERADRQRSQIQRKAKRAVKKRIRDEVAQGKRGAYYLKRSEQKRMEVEARFDELRKEGGDAAVNKALAKRRKKMAAKEKRKLPPKGTH